MQTKSLGDKIVFLVTMGWTVYPDATKPGQMIAENITQKGLTVEAAYEVSLHVLFSLHT